MTRPIAAVTQAARDRMLNQCRDRVGLRAHREIGPYTTDIERREAYATAARAEAALLRAIAAELESMYSA